MQQAKMRSTLQPCRDCHTDYISPHHADYWANPNSPNNPYCPDPPPDPWQCMTCHYNYDEDCGWVGENPVSVTNACAGCHTLLSSHCGWALDLSSECRAQIIPGECAGLPQTPDVVATIDIDPDTLNLNWITCYIELPEGYDVNQIDVNTVTLSVEGATPIEAALSPTEVGDYDNDSVPDLMVKFDRGVAQSVVSEGSVEMTVVGSLTDGTAFQGTDTVLVIDKGQEHMNDNP